jgi:hypothetical protein
MFEAIAHIIPPYQRIYEVCKRNTPDAHTKAEDYDLAALISYVYADLVQFFLELYQTFCRGTQGMSGIFQLSAHATGSSAASSLEALSLVVGART